MFHTLDKTRAILSQHSVKKKKTMDGSDHRTDLMGKRHDVISPCFKKQQREPIEPISLNGQSIRTRPAINP